MNERKDAQVNRDGWWSSRDLALSLEARRDRNDTMRVVVNGVLVPIADAHYDDVAGVVVILLDEHGEDYQIAMCTDPAPDQQQ
jgi:hypothetical protein